jgi:hypothetical protein
MSEQLHLTSLRLPPALLGQVRNVAEREHRSTANTMRLLLLIGLASFEGPATAAENENKGD